MGGMSVCEACKARKIFFDNPIAFNCLLCCLPQPLLNSMSRNTHTHRERERKRERAFKI